MIIRGLNHSHISPTMPKGEKINYSQRSKHDDPLQWFMAQLHPCETMIYHYFSMID